MKEQKVIITHFETTINEWLERGWEIVSVTAGYVSIASPYSAKEKGDFCFVIQRQNSKS